MDYEALASQVGNAVGIIEKGLIVFYRNPNKKIVVDKPVAAGSGGGFLGTLSDVVDAATDAVNSVTDYVNSIVQKNDLKTDDNKIVFPVQFNPSRISINGTVRDPSTENTFVENMEDGAKFNVAKDAQSLAQSPDYYLSFQLIFDDVSEPDAFLSNKIIASQDLFKAAYNTVKVVSGFEKTHTVRPVMEAFTAATRLMGPDGCLGSIAFLWNEMSYYGTLLSCDANYVMFNPMGEPIRGTIDLQIKLDFKQNMPMGPFSESYFKFTNNAGGKLVDDGTIGSKASGITNITL